MASCLGLQPREQVTLGSTGARPAAVAVDGKPHRTIARMAQQAAHLVPREAALRSHVVGRRQRGVAGTLAFVSTGIALAHSLGVAVVEELHREGVRLAATSPQAIASSGAGV